MREKRREGVLGKMMGGGTGTDRRGEGGSSEEEDITQDTVPSSTMLQSTASARTPSVPEQVAKVGQE